MVSVVCELEIHVPVLGVKLAHSHVFIFRGTVCNGIGLWAEFDCMKSNGRDDWAFFFCCTCNFIFIQV